VVSGGTVSVKLNNILGPYIKSHKGVRQGDPLSPILFNFVADGLFRMILKAQSNNLLCGSGDHIIEKGVVVLQYTDDTIICLKHDIKGARNMKLLLYMYGLMAGLIINFSKSEVITISDEDNWDGKYADIFNVQVGTFPIKYLGVPVSSSRLHVCDWMPLIDKSMKKLDIWKGRTMSIAGKSTLISSSLNNAPIYHMSIYLLRKTILGRLDKIRRTFFWQGGFTKRKYHLIKWTKICKSKKKGGLGIKDIRKMNVSLLVKWWWKLDNEEDVWQKNIKHKYLKSESILDVSHKQSDSAIWADLLKVKNIYLQGRKKLVRNGKTTFFWKDNWLYEKPLCIVYPVLFKFCQQQNILVDQVRNNLQSVSFTRWLMDDMLTDWQITLSDMRKINFTSNKDSVAWTVGTAGRFSVKSVYNAMTFNDSGPSHSKIWKSKIPAKIKIFLWLLLNNAVLTKDNLIKRKWVGNPTCYICNQIESASHLFFQCSTAKAVWAIVARCIGANNVPKSLNQCWLWCERWLPFGKQFHTMGIAAICWAIWKTRNKVCFEEKNQKPC
jgi:hypothetical protein